MIEYNQVKIGQRIKQLRKAMRMSQQALARAYSLSQTTVCNIENGNTFPNITTLLELSNFFNRKVSYLLCEDDSEIVTPNSMSL